MSTDRTQSPQSAEAAERGHLERERAIYRHRFSEAQQKTRREVWKILCERFFQSWIPEDATVVDLAAGDGLFIRNIRARRRIAVDVGPKVLTLAEHGVEAHQAPADELADRLDAPADVVFMSNFLEHLPTKKAVLEVLEAVHRALTDGGRLLILQPNIRYVGPAYWDYIDHQIALTEHSLVEAAEISGFEVEHLIPRFLPYTAKSRLGNFSGLTGLYLRLPFLWRFFGSQTFLAARRSPAAGARHD